VRPLVIAHRGNSAHRPENTLASFSSALEIGAELVELDVQMTCDGEVVVLHDPTVDRTTSGKGAIASLSLAAARELSAGYPSRFGAAFASERIPILAEALDLMRGRARVMIEIKPDAVGAHVDDGIEEKTLRIVRDCGVLEEVAILSFDGRALVRCRDLAPAVPRGKLFYRASIEVILASCEECGCRVAMPEKGMLSEEVARTIHQAGLELGVWVVDDPTELPMLLRLRPSGIASNDPGPIMAALAAD
jgi:glycerophosphoryl diester phosphodiesterase